MTIKVTMQLTEDLDTQHPLTVLMLATELTCSIIALTAHTVGVTFNRTQAEHAVSRVGLAGMETSTRFQKCDLGNL